MQIAILIAAVLACVSQATLASLPVNAEQLTAWQTIFDTTGGLNWLRCKGKRESPCTCTGTVEAQVACVAVNGENFISNVRLRSNRLVGPEYPTDAINTLIGGFDAFVQIDMRSNPGLLTTASCLDIPNCAGTTCRFSVDVCAASLSPSVTQSPSTPQTKSPTINALPAWTTFHTATVGANWTKCRNTATTPCECQRNQPTSSPIKVTCNGVFINRISLIANNLVAAEFPSQAVTDMINGGVVQIDLTQNPSLASSAQCFDVPACRNAGVTCTFDKDVCAVTGPPVTAPPAGSPVPTTVTPTTASPSSVAPTTPVPTTVAPSTARPTTIVPTATTGPSATGGPAVPPVTSQPTPSESTAPTASPTVITTVSPAPTADNSTTAAPTPQIAPGNTNSPTVSMAVQINGAACSVAISMVVAALLM